MCIEDPAILVKNNVLITTFYPINRRTSENPLKLHFPCLYSILTMVVVFGFTVKSTPVPALFELSLRLCLLFGAIFKSPASSKNKHTA